MNKKHAIGWGILGGIGFVGGAFATVLSGMLATVAFSEAFKKEEK